MIKKIVDFFTDPLRTDNKEFNFSLYKNELLFLATDWTPAKKFPFESACMDLGNRKKNSYKLILSFWKKVSYFHEKFRSLTVDKNVINRKEKK